MVKLKLKKGDQVIVIAGKDKGKKGEIIRVLPNELKVVVRGVNIVNRHLKANDQRRPASEELPIHICKVAYLDPEQGVATRLGFKFEQVGDLPARKVRIAKKSGKIIG
jgi:large subunit ribosomal protein L24